MTYLFGNNSRQKIRINKSIRFYYTLSSKTCRRTTASIVACKITDEARQLRQDNLLDDCSVCMDAPVHTGGAAKPLVRQGEAEFFLTLGAVTPVATTTRSILALPTPFAFGMMSLHHQWQDGAMSHSFFDENKVNKDIEVCAKSSRKRRRRRAKENYVASMNTFLVASMKKRTPFIFSFDCPIIQGQKFWDINK